jgi:hypothetical protein
MKKHENTRHLIYIFYNKRLPASSRYFGANVVLFARRGSKDANHKDYKAAIDGLESWGRDTKGLETHCQTAE